MFDLRCKKKNKCIQVKLSDNVEEIIELNQNKLWTYWLSTGMEKVPKLPVAEFDRIPKAADILAVQLMFWQVFFEQKVILCVKMVFSDKICQQIWKPPSSIATLPPHFLHGGFSKGETQES